MEYKNHIISEKTINFHEQAKKLASLFPEITLSPRNITVACVIGFTSYGLLRRLYRLGKLSFITSSTIATTLYDIYDVL